MPNQAAQARQWAITCAKAMPGIRITTVLPMNLRATYWVDRYDIWHTEQNYPWRSDDPR